MKTTAKKTLSVLLSLLMVLSVFAGMTFTAGAASSGTCGDYLTWTLDNGLLIISGTGDMDYRAFEANEEIRAVVIRSGVTSVGASAFAGCSNLTSVTFPDGLKFISGNAFNGCSGLTSVTIPDSVDKIYSNAFEGCSALTSVVIPDGVTEIFAETFKNCSGLTSVIIPDSVTYIAYGAFIGCSSLTDVILPNGLKDIKPNLFEGCASLTSVTIPAGMENILYAAFSGCTSLTDVYYAESKEDWSRITIISGGNESLTNAERIHYNCVNGAVGHNTVTPGKPATCTEEGQKIISCPCGESYTHTESIPATGHVYVDHDPKAPTCGEAGWDAYQTCANCDYSTYSEIPATGKHTTELVNAKEATATEDGYTGDEVCTVCGNTIKTGEIIPATGESGGETAAEGPGVCEYCGETHDVNTITGFFTDMLHDMLYIVMRLTRFFCYEIFVS